MIFFWLDLLILVANFRTKSNFSYISLLGVNFENLTVEFHAPYVLNITYQISFKSDIIYYLINKLIFYIQL